MNTKEQYEKIFRALGDSHRLTILMQLTEREMNAGEILETVDVVQSTLSHHMKTLCESGLVSPRKSGKWTCYTINREVLHSAEEFLVLMQRQMKTDMPDQKSDRENTKQPAPEKPRVSEKPRIPKKTQEPEKRMLPEKQPVSEPQPVLKERPLPGVQHAEDLFSAEEISYDVVRPKPVKEEAGEDDRKTIKKSVLKTKGKGKEKQREKAKEKGKTKDKNRDKKSKDGKGKKKQGILR